MAEKFADHLRLESKKSGSFKEKNLAKQLQAGGKKKSSVHPGDDHGPCASGAKKPSGNDPPTSADLKLLAEYTFTCSKGWCRPPDAVTVSGLPAAAVRMVGLSTAQVCKIYKCFQKIDLDKSKQIDFAEFCEFIDTLPTAFTKDVCDRMVFSITDLDGDGQLSFDEFLLAAILLGTFSQDQILFFMFEIFDENDNQFIDRKELAHLTAAVEELAGSMFPGNYSSFCEKFDKNGDGLIDFNEFVGIHKNFPMIFFPALRMQESMRKHTLSRNTWGDFTANFDANHRKALQQEFDAQVKEALKGGSEAAPKQPRQPKSFYEQILELGAKKGVLKKKKTAGPTKAKSVKIKQ